VRTPRKRSLRNAGRDDVDPLDARAARAAALDILSRRDYSSGELRSKLLGKRYDVTVIAELIERLRAEKLLDDARYLENYVAYHASRGQGPNRVREDLRRFGLPGAEVEATLAAYPDWLTQLKRAREKKFGTSLPTNYADRQRQARFLAYRGFNAPQIRSALGLDTELDADTTYETRS
jgi:regulatory protein